MMEGSYGECVVKRKGTAAGTAIKVGLVTLTAIFAGSFVVASWMLLLAMAVGFVTYLIWPQFDVTYEYVFVDGQLDFDKILGGNGRKHVKRIDMDAVEVIAPKNSHALDGYRHLSVKPQDFTSLMQTDEAKIYVIVFKGEKGIELILFEPDENMLKLLKSKSMRKVVQY